MNDILIRDIVPEDMPQTQLVFYKTWLASYPNAEFGITVDDIEGKYASQNNPERLRQLQERVRNLPKNERYLVCEVGGTVVGVCRLVIDDAKNNLQAIYVLPEYQGKGIGTMFWAEALKFFDPKKPVSVCVATYNAKAIAFYKKLGFKETGRVFNEERLRMKSGAIIPQTELLMGV